MNNLYLQFNQREDPVVCFAMAAEKRRKQSKSTAVDYRNNRPAVSVYSVVVVAAAECCFCCRLQ